MLRVLKGKDPAVKERAEYMISDFMRQYENADPFSLSISEHHAYRRLKALGFTVKESKTHLSLTVRIDDDSLPIKQIELFGEDFSLAISDADLYKELEESGVYNIECDPYISAEQAVFIVITDRTGYDLYSNDIILMPNEGTVWIEIYENDFSGGEIWTDLIAEKWNVAQS